MLLSPSMGALLFTAGRFARRQRGPVISGSGRLSSAATPEDRSGVLLPAFRLVAVVGPVGHTTHLLHATGERSCEHSPVERLAAKTQPLDERAVAVDVGLLEVLQEPAATADEPQQTPTSVVVVLVRL